MTQTPLGSNLWPVAMGYYPNAHRHHMQRSSLDSTLFIYCTAGRGKLTLEGKQYAIKAGDIALLPAHSAHSYESNKTDPWSIYWLHFNGALVDDFCQHLDMQSPVEDIGLQASLISQLESLLTLRHSGYNPAAFIHGCLQLQQLISYMSLVIKQQRSQSGKQIDLDAARAFMNEHLHGQLNLETLAAHSQLSKYYFSKRFKTLTGHSPIQYFIYLKMQHACELLDTSSQAIKLIAMAVGYDDAYYFSRLFKKVIGLSPDQYRKSKHR